MSTGSVGATGASGTTDTSSSASSGGTDRLRDLDMSVFLDLMIEELSNQDPMNPMDNSEMLGQINQIREIASNDRLSDTLEAVLMGNNLATATGIIGKQVKALSDNSEFITGTVQKVTIDDDEVKLTVGDQIVDLKNVAEILPAETS